MDIICNFCGNKQTTIKFQVCGGCRLVKYCSRNCQKSDWKNHRSDCKDVEKLASKQMIDESRIFIKRIHEKLMGDIVYLDVIQDNGEVASFEYNKNKIGELEEILTRFSKGDMMDTFKRYFSMVNHNICVVLVINAGIPFIQVISVNDYKFLDL